jgi:serine protease AprX
MAFVDSGFFPHPDIQDRIALFVDATNRRVREGNLAASTAGLNWHGQMTSVIAAGNGAVGGGKYRGIASDARLILIKVSNRKSQIKEADILRGLEWLVRNARRHNVRVVNVSVGGDFPNLDASHPLHVAVRKLTEDGVVVLCAAGNFAGHPVLPPASAGSAITVGGYDDRNSLDQAVWSYRPSSLGMGDDGSHKPDVLAPAAWIASPIMPGTEMARDAQWLMPMMALKAGDVVGFQRLARKASTELHLAELLRANPPRTLIEIVQERIHAHKLIDLYHQHVDGTSVSVAIASSMVAALLEAHPSLTPAQVKERVMTTARPLPDVSSECQGAGIVDLNRAIIGH